MASIFTKIKKREIDGKIFFEDDDIFVIADHRPKDNVHLLIIPTQEHKNFFETPPEVLQRMLETAKMVAEQLGIKDHFRLVLNNGYGQEVDHVHLHFMSNRGEDKLSFKE